MIFNELPKLPDKNAGTTLTLHYKQFRSTSITFR